MEQLKLPVVGGIVHPKVWEICSSWWYSGVAYNTSQNMVLFEVEVTGTQKQLVMSAMENIFKNNKKSIIWRGQAKQCTTQLQNLCRYYVCH